MGYLTPPAQIRTGPIKAYGSHLEWMTGRQVIGFGGGGCLHRTRSGLHPGLLLSRLDGWAVRAPVNASLAASRRHVHDSGSMRFATPSSQRTSTAYFLRRTRVEAYAEAQHGLHCPWNVGPCCGLYPSAPVKPARSRRWKSAAMKE